MGRTVAVVVVILLLLVILATPVSTRQNPPQAIPRFKTGVELVLLDVSVLDADRRPVRGLTAGDFTVLEDGRPQAIASFSAVDLPDVVEETASSAPWVRTVVPDVQKNTDLKDRRIVVIVMDDATAMPAVEVPRAKTLARRAIEALGPGDLACVAFTLDRKSGQEFTQDRARLLAAVERFNGALDYQPGVNAVGGMIPFDAFNAGAATLYHATLATLRGMADSLAELPERRKALMFISVGIPFEMGVTEVVEGGGAGAAGVLRQLAVDLQDSLAAAQRANVAIYGLDPGGLRAPGDQAVRSAEPNHPGRLNADFLKTVSENTGGFAVVDTNAPEQQIQQILRENASYYLLGYAPSNTRAQGRYRRLEVKVNRPGVTVRARNGYFEPRPAGGSPKAAGTRPSPSSTALAGILPRADLSMALAAAPFAVPGQRDAALAVVLGVQRPAPARAMRITESVDVQLAAYAPGGQHRASTHQIIPVGVSTSGLGGTIGYELLLRLDVPPGRYQLRVAAERSPQGAGATDDDTSGKSGSVYADLDVPDFSKEALSLSGLALSVSPSVVSGPKGALASVMPIVPTTMREFRTGDRVTAFLQAYQGGARSVVAATVTVRMVDAQGASVFETTETVGPERFGAARAADYRLDLPMMKLAPGMHLLTIEATSGRTKVRREVRFAVR